MAKFNWDDHPAEDSFDWDAHAPEDSEAEKPGYLESAARGLGQGASLGFADEITGGLESLLSDKTYEQARDESRAAYKSAQEANPMTYGASELGGGVATAFVPGLNIAKGATLANIAAKSALSAGINAAGSSGAQNVGDLVRDTATGAATGGVLGGTLGKVAPKLGEAWDWGAGKIGAGTKDLAERFGARALGAERGTIKKIGYDKIKDAARQSLDKGVLSPLASTDDVIARNAALKKSGGEMMGQAYDAIDNAGASTFNPLEAATKVDEELGGFYRSPINRGETAQLENTLESILLRGDQNIPLAEAQKLKEELGKVANWKNSLNPTEKETMARRAYGIVNGQIDDAVESGAKAVDAAGLTDVLKKGKEQYGNASTAEQLLQNKQAREQGNNILGLTDAITGAGALGYGGYTGDWKTAGGVMLAKKGLQKYGNQMAATGIDKISKALMKSPKMAELYSSNPQVFNTLANKMASKVMPEQKKEERPFETDSLLEKTQGTKYAQVLQNAAKRGQKSVGAAHFILQSTDPEYRKQFMEEQE